MNEKQSCILAIDMGGTSIKSALFDGDEVIPDSFFRFPVDSGGSEACISTAFKTFANAVAGNAGVLGRRITAVAMSIPGPFDYLNGVFRMTHKYASVKGQAVWPWLKEALGSIPILFSDDASSVLNGAQVLENMSSRRNLCSVNIGTGLGFGSKVDGKMLIREDGYPGISIWNRPYREANIESYVTRDAIIRNYERRSGKQGLDVYDISVLARNGDPAACDAFREMGRNCGMAIADIIREYRFEALLLGGSISKSSDLFLDELKAGLHNAGLHIEVRPIRDIDMAPLYGAVRFYLQGIRPTLLMK